MSWCLICRKTESKASWLACWLSLVRAALGSANRLELPVPFSWNERKEMGEKVLYRHFRTSRSFTELWCIYRMLYLVPLRSKGPPSNCCIQPCFLSEGSCTPARGSWWRSSSQWSWPPECLWGCVDYTSLTSTFLQYPESFGETGIISQICLQLIILVIYYFSDYFYSTSVNQGKKSLFSLSVLFSDRKSFEKKKKLWQHK